MRGQARLTRSRLPRILRLAGYPPSTNVGARDGDGPWVGAVAVGPPARRTPPGVCTTWACRREPVRKQTSSQGIGEVALLFQPQVLPSGDRGGVLPDFVRLSPPLAPMRVKLWVPHHQWAAHAARLGSPKWSYAS
jgi:hypothetical protein